MSKPLPYADFRWFDSDKIESLDVCNLDEYVGYILEVDLHHQKALQDRNSDSVSARSLSITPDMLPPLSLNRLYFTKGFSGSETPSSSVHKLLTNIDDKQNDDLHFRNVKLYLSLCLQSIGC